MNNNKDETNTLLLWSWQTRGFSLTEGSVDHRLSEFDKTHDGYRNSCKQLLELLGTDQFIWCDTEDARTWNHRVKWELEVPKGHVVLICSIAWHWIMARNAEDSVGCVPPEKFFNLARKLDPCLSRDEFQQRFHDGWKSKTTEELWAALFVNTVQSACTHALVPYTVKAEWVNKYPS